MNLSGPDRNVGNAWLTVEKKGTQGNMRTVHFPLAISSRLISLESLGLSGLSGRCRTSSAEGLLHFLSDSFSCPLRAGKRKLLEL